MRALRLRLLALAASIAACSSQLDHTNPFDPEAPPQLQARATLSGRVVLEQVGAAAPDPAGTQISVAGAGGTLTGSDGTWTLQAVAPGTYAVEARRDGYVTARREAVVVTLDDGDRVVSAPEMALQAARGDLAGHVALSAGTVLGWTSAADAAGALVTVAGAGVVAGPALADGAGRFRIPRVPVLPAGGAYVVTASLPPYFEPASVEVQVAAGETAEAPALALAARAGAAAGLAILDDDATVAGGNAHSAGVAISVEGVAFDGAAVIRAGLTDDAGGYTVGELPAGRYEVTASAPDRRCTGPVALVVEPGSEGPAAPSTCLDALAPGAVVLGLPAPAAGADAGYLRTTSAAVRLVLPAVDATTPSNLRGYELATGAEPDWARATRVDDPAATGLTFTGLPPNEATVLWARGVDLAGNAGVAASVAVVHDDVPPPQPTISTPRAVVDATSTAVTLFGSEADVHLRGYETCVLAVDAPAACPACSCPTAGPCSCGSGATRCDFAPAPATSAVAIPADRRACVYGRAVDRAGNASPLAALSVVSDLTRPSPPAISPTFEAAALEVRADAVEFAVQGPAGDLPLGGGAWANVAWLEVDDGSGFQPLCPQDACHASGAYAPCGACACSDPRLVCGEGALRGVRVPLRSGAASTISFRTVDLAGNVGAGISQQVNALPLLSPLLATAEDDEDPRLEGSTLVYAIGATTQTWVMDLGPDRRASASDPRCALGWGSVYRGGLRAAVAKDGLVVFVDGAGAQVALRRRLAGKAWCAGETSVTLRYATAGSEIDAVAASGERLAWSERVGASGARTVYVLEPGANGVLGTGGDDVLVSLGTFADVTALEMGGGHVLVRTGPEYQPAAWAAYSAGAGGFAGAPPRALTALAAGLSRSGDALAWLDATTLRVQAPGTDGLLLTSDDRVASHAVTTATNRPYVAVDGDHAVVVTSADPAPFVHWSAGGDHRFGTGDDGWSELAPSSVGREDPAVSDGLLVFQNGIGVSEGTDLVAVDLGTDRWEAAAFSSLEYPATDGAGTLFYLEASKSGVLRARSSAGVQTSNAIQPSSWKAEPGLLLVSTLDRTWQVFRPDSAGVYFTAGATASPVNMPAAPVSGWSESSPLALGDGKIAMGLYAASLGGVEVWVWDPASGAVEGATPLRVAAAVPYFYTLAISRDALLYSCASNNVCLREAGSDHRFDATDATAAVLRKGGGAGAAFYPVFEVKVSGTRLALKEGNSLWLLDAGRDGRFNTADDVETLIDASLPAWRAFDLAGNWLVWTNVGSGVDGTQAWLRDLRTGFTRALTTHYSGKTYPLVDASGRVYWQDAVFAPRGIFVHAP
jgi:hypothetical protein